jgi:hypothetical protein
VRPVAALTFGLGVGVAAPRQVGDAGGASVPHTPCPPRGVARDDGAEGEREGERSVFPLACEMIGFAGPELG